MYLYNNKNGNLDPIKEVGFKLEKDMQSLTEKNLKEIFGLEFVVSEFQHNNLRIDTLVFDNESNSFVIIEFKKGSSYSVIDQGFSYLSLMLNNKADFILLLQDNKKKAYKKDDIDWSQSKVIFIADAFTRYQQESINFKDLPIELWEMKQFSNGNIVYNQIKASNTSESIKTITKLEGNLKEIEKEIKTYSLSDLLKNDWKETRELYEEIKEKIISLDSNIEEKFNKYYIAYQIGKSNVVSLHVYKSKVVVHLPKIQLNDINDYKKLAHNVPEERGWGKIVEFNIESKEDIIYAMDLIQQAYKKYY